MNPLLMKQTAILSAILGGILGVLTLIPFVRNFSFMILILCISAVVIVYMKRHELIGIIDLREGALLGAIIGFVSFIAFSVVFIPLVTIVGWIFKGYYTYGISYMLKVSGFFVLVMLIIFLAILSALMNAFAGLVTAYVYEVLLGIKKEEKEKESIEFEIKE
ncbi:MAG TPA: hypothetical protein PKI94_05265 [Candidatus Gastranaerophilaceae bacterium]|nr:hypothetical protein [Candidatus Gastranaerophilaceae bacterium]